jgi:hypothetical protein
LKDVGGDELENGYSTVIWSICDAPVLLFQKKDKVLDAIQLPAIPKEQLPLATTCKQKGKAIAGVLPVMKPGAAESAPNVQQAWRLDYKQGRIVPLPVEDLICPPP